MFGTGCLVMPYAFSLAGIFGGPVLMIMICALNLISMNFLVDAKRYFSNMGASPPFMDYGDLAESAIRNGPLASLYKYAHLGKLAVNVMLTITQVGYSSVYLLFVAETMESLFEQYGLRQFHFQWLIAICTFPAFITTSIIDLGLYLCAIFLQ